MTYLQNKKIFFSLIDEYAPNNNYFTDDDDARIKCALLYSTAYQELSEYRTKKEIQEYSITGDPEHLGFLKRNLPTAYLIHSIVGMDENNNFIPVKYKILGEFIYISNEKDVKVVIEYEPYLEPITQDTPDSYELKIDQDLQMILPYKAAADLFKTDPGENYAAFEKEYQRRLANIRTSKFGISANISEGEF